MTQTPKVPAPLPGDLENAVIDALHAFRARNPGATPGEIALRLSTVISAVIVSGCEEAQVHYTLERTQSYLESFTDHLIAHGSGPLASLFATVRRCDPLVIPFPRRAARPLNDGGGDAA